MISTSLWLTFAVIPPPLYEQLDGTTAPLKSSTAGVEEVMSAKYQYYDDAVLQED